MADDDDRGCPPFLDLMRPRPTGNVLVVFDRESEDAQLRVLERAARRAGLGRDAAARAMTAVDLAAVDLRAAPGPMLLRGYGIGLVPGDWESAVRTSGEIAAETGVMEARPEFFLFPDLEPPVDSAARTWGVAAVGAEASPFTGRGVRIAVLDTGLDGGHPDFAGRRIFAEGFVPGEDALADPNGHGTHCAGTAAGPRAAGNRPRYGVAPEADLYVGKVLGDEGFGGEVDILAGMAWAIEEGCEIVSMSLSRAVQPGERPSLAYERLGRAALDRGCLVIAAAGNFSSREFGHVAPVAAPANSPSILAVAAIAADGSVAPFSYGGLEPDGGEIDLAGPGVDVFSAFPRPRLYRALQGTSMACPHVAGVAALWAESDPALRGAALARRLAETAAPLAAPARDVGRGLVRAPAAPVA